MEQVFILILLVMFAAIHGLAQWRRGIANARNTNLPTHSELDADGYALDPFEAAMVEPPRIEPPMAPRAVPHKYPARVAQKPLPRSPSRTGAPPAQPRTIDAGLRDTGLMPQNEAELRRAIALVAIFGPPRALDPPR